MRRIAFTINVYTLSKSKALKFFLGIDKILPAYKSSTFRFLLLQAREVYATNEQHQLVHIEHHPPTYRYISLTLGVPLHVLLNVPIN